MYIYVCDKCVYVYKLVRDYFIEIYSYTVGFISRNKVLFKTNQTKPPRK